ncbi:MAG: hypothetical protein ABI130_14095 [Leifsonia sp.]
MTTTPGPAAAAAAAAVPAAAVLRDAFAWLGTPGLLGRDELLVTA